jgi:F0F1-type ATP synthase epsilon subunit
VYFQGLATSISAENDTGPFDVLPKHDNFICLLKPCDLVIRSSQEGDRKIQISGGVMHVKANIVTVFLDI